MRRRTNSAVKTIKWRLTEMLADLELTRVELAERSELSDRVIRHIERADKRVLRSTLEKVTAALGAVWAERHPGEPLFPFIADAFIDNPVAAIRAMSYGTFLIQSGVIRQFGDHFSPDLYGYWPGCRSSIPFAGVFRGPEGAEAQFRSMFEPLAMTPEHQQMPSIYGPQGDTMIVTTSMVFTHRESGVLFPLRTACEFSFRGPQIYRMIANCDTAALAEFLDTGKCPRASDRVSVS